MMIPIAAERKYSEVDEKLIMCHESARAMLYVKTWCNESDILW